MRQLWPLLLIALATPAIADDPKKFDADEVDMLVEQLGHKTWQTRELASKRLIEIGEPAIPQLKAAVDDDNLERRWRVRQVLIALGALVDPEVLAKVRALLAITIDERQGLPQRTGARQQLVAIGGPALSAFFQILVEKDYRLRRHVTELVVYFESRQVVPLMLKALEDEDNFVKSGAAKSLRYLTKQDLASYELEKWHAWWEANRAEWKPPAPPTDPEAPVAPPEEDGRDR